MSIAGGDGEAEVALVEVSLCDVEFVWERPVLDSFSAADREELVLDDDDICRGTCVAERRVCDDEPGAEREPREGSAVGLVVEADSVRILAGEGKYDSGSSFSRRRILGEGTSGFSDGRGGPFRNPATVLDAESYVRSSSSPSLLRLPLVAESTVDKPALPLPLLPVGAESRRLV